jgi:hypothetical protein
MKPWDTKFDRFSLSTTRIQQLLSLFSQIRDQKIKNKKLLYQK